MRTIERAILNRTTLLVGDTAMERIAAARVIIFGVGGVGSWCAESLVRSGICNLTIVDSDRVCITNVNRQSMATTRTVGRVKVEALKERLLEINPAADITAVQEIFNADTADGFHLEEYDYIIDAIDSLKDKLELILRCTQKAQQPQPTFYSSMGAALKMDPTQVKVSEFWQVDGCPLAAVLRRRMRKQKRFPGRKFQCVWGPEVLPNLGQARTCGTEACMCPKASSGDGRADLLNHEWCTSKAQINGTTAHITALFGFTLAGLIIQDLYRKAINVHSVAR
ncbi:MAG: tRNA threonylcarbamoyladenosine dehydratase [Bacteroidales bacterium]|nr:tRNA threonylcarbamoyladenosine dehydratase [Bacteroidales bacterium]